MSQKKKMKARTPKVSSSSSKNNESFHSKSEYSTILLIQV